MAASDDAQDFEHSRDALVQAVLHNLEAETGGIAPDSVTYRGEHSNDVFEIHFPKDRTMIVKWARFDWGGPRFKASRRASELLREEAGIVAPHHLDLASTLLGRPVLAYWKIPNPTLKELWQDIPDEKRTDVLRSLGRLIRRIHNVRLPGSGLLPDAARPDSSLSDFLRSDLVDRLEPALSEQWPSGLSLVQELVEATPEVAERSAETDSVLVHNDLHMSNILCEVEDDDVRCVGVIDLEAAWAAPAAADLATMEVLQSPPVAPAPHEDWVEAVFDGYGKSFDPGLMRFFRSYHLINLGFHAALLGHDHRAEEIGQRARLEDVASYFGNGGKAAARV